MVADRNKNEEIPSGWAQVKLGDVLQVIRGASPRPKGDPRYFGGDIPWIKISDITKEKGKFISTTKDHVTEEGAQKSRYLEAGTLILSNSGTVCVPKILAADGCIHDGFVAFPELPDEFHILYLYYFFDNIRPQIINENRQGITQVNLNTTIVKNIDLPVAPIKEQNRIVAEIEKQFSRLDEAVDNLKRVKANLKRYKASVLKSAVEGKLTEEWAKANPDVEPAGKLLNRILAERRKKWEETELAKMKAKGKEPKDDKWKKKYKEPAKPDLNDLPVLPKEWKWVTWDTILEFDKGAFKRGPFGSSLKKSIFVDSGYKVYEQYCPINDDCSFARYFITDEKYNELKAFAVQAKDFLISCSGVTLGRITQVPDDYDEGVINQALLRVRLNNNIFDDSFFKMLFRSPYFQKQIFKNATGSAIPNVKGVNELKAIPLPLATLEEQSAIITILEEYMSVISVFDRQVDKNLKRAERLRQSILKKAFSGKLIQS